MFASCFNAPPVLGFQSLRSCPRVPLSPHAKNLPPLRRKPSCPKVSATITFRLPPRALQYTAGPRAITDWPMSDTSTPSCLFCSRSDSQCFVVCNLPSTAARRKARAWSRAMLPWGQTTVLSSRTTASEAPLVTVRCMARLGVTALAWNLGFDERGKLREGLLPAEVAHLNRNDFR